MYKKIICLIIITLNTQIFAVSRVKDIAGFEGVRENLLVGYGLVVGLNGTGDNLQNSLFTQKGLNDFLERLGVNVQGASLKTKNIAAVTVTARLPAFARQGSKIDVNVSALGDAKSIKGGTLIATPLLGADGNVYAVAQGSISIPSFNPASQDVKTKDKSQSTTGFIQNGAIVEEEIDFKLSDLDKIKLSLHNPDFTTALAISDAINDNIPGNSARAIDAGTVEITIPNYKKSEMVSFLSEVERLEITTDYKAKVVIEEASGTVVLGEHVRISPVAVSQGNLFVTITPGQQTQDAFALKPEEEDPRRGSRAEYVGSAATLQELVDGLNQMGVWPRDIINILQNIKAAGALQAEIEVR